MLKRVWWGKQANLMGWLAEDARSPTLEIYDRVNRLLRAHSAFVVLHLDDMPFVLLEQPLSTQDFHDRSTFCDVYPLFENGFPPSFEWPTKFGMMHVGNSLCEFRLHAKDDNEILYATDESTGVCILEVGTERVDEMVPPAGRRSLEGLHRSFRFAFDFNPNGIQRKYLWPVEDVEPIEIVVKYDPPMRKQTTYGGLSKKRTAVRAAPNINPLRAIRRRKP